MFRELRTIAWDRSMRFFQVDQRSVHARCEEILARVPPSGHPDHEVHSDVARVELLPLLGAFRLTDGTTVDGVASLLLGVQKTRDPEAVRRSIARAIPAFGAVRIWRVFLAIVALVAVTVLLARISGLLVWVAAAVAAVLGAWILDPASRRFLRLARDVKYVVWLEDAARAAEKDNDAEAVNMLYAESRCMIAEDRVPAGIGFRLAFVLRAARIATPFPVGLLCELQQLLFIAPETEVGYWHVKKEIVRSLRERADWLASSIRRSLQQGKQCDAKRAELREIARSGPGIIGARRHQAEILQHLVHEALDAAPTAELGDLLDEIEELLERLESLPGGVPGRDSSPDELARVLDEVASRSSAPSAVERARVLRARVQALPSRPVKERPAPPRHPSFNLHSRSLLRRMLSALRWHKTSRPIAELHVAVTANVAPDEQRPRVLALYRQVRDTTSRRHRSRPLTDLITAMRLAATWATRGKGEDAALLREIRDDARALIAHRRVPADTDAELAGVLRDCVHADEFPITLLDDYAALRRLSPYSVPAHYWSIVDAAILRVEARLREIASAGDAAAHASLRDLAAAFVATATRSSNRDIVDRAHDLARRAAELAQPDRH